MKHATLAIILAALIFTCTHCQQKEYPNFDITLQCYMYQAAFLQESIYVSIYDRQNNLICNLKTDKEAKINVSLKANELYYLDAYGLDENGYYIEGYTHFYLKPDKTYDIINIKMDYSEEYY
ncbi:MAG: hypothetical protein PHC83_07325 [Bacteroidales bacterium]|jgi:uncharacterized protein YcfL|nr:hypothetical protein [Bacteroidales bacterium]MDD4210441.1 hypothetical protein [Bacteroidales bacterium]MDY0015267.1 hypothetical protein [Bacteroidales bacterium]